MKKSNLENYYLSRKALEMAIVNHKDKTEKYVKEKFSWKDIEWDIDKIIDNLIDESLSIYKPLLANLNGTAKKLDPKAEPLTFSYIYRQVNGGAPNVKF